MIRLLNYIRYFLILICILIVALNSYVNGLKFICIFITFMTLVLEMILNLIIPKLKLNCIKKYIDNQKNDNTGNYVYWNADNILLTENHIYILRVDSAFRYEYDDVLRIESFYYFLSRGSHYFRKIYFKDGSVTNVHEKDNFIDCQFEDIPKYMIKKNNAIHIELPKIKYI